MTIIHEFVEFIPEKIQHGTVYISIKYKSVVHSCICGCGNKVVTPLSPTDWRITFDGRNISLYPSIGNWNFDCKSHYWIKNNQIIQATSWSDEEINENRRYDKKQKKKYYRKKIFLRYFWSIFQF